MCRRVMAALGRAYYFCMGFRVVVKGKQVNSSEAPILAVAPHSTFFDGIVCIMAGLPSTVSRVENLATPIFGSETLFVCTVVSGQESEGVWAPRKLFLVITHSIVRVNLRKKCVRLPSSECTVSHPL